MVNSFGASPKVNHTRRSAISGWIVMGLIALTLPLEIGWYLFAGSEPYPALVQPTFKSVLIDQGVYEGRTISLAAILSDGSAVPISGYERMGLQRKGDDLFFESGNQAPFVIDSIVASHSVLDPRSRAQLRTEISSILPGADVAFLRVDAQEHRYVVDENLSYPSSPVETTLIDLRNDG